MYFALAVEHSVEAICILGKDLTPVGILIYHRPRAPISSNKRGNISRDTALGDGECRA